jgi:hypothetical protein
VRGRGGGKTQAGEPRRERRVSREAGGGDGDRGPTRGGGVQAWRCCGRAAGAALTPPPLAVCVCVCICAACVCACVRSCGRCARSTRPYACTGRWSRALAAAARLWAFPRVLCAPACPRALRARSRRAPGERAAASPTLDCDSQRAR